MEKRKTISDLMIGEKIESVFLLQSLSGNTSCILKDKTAEIAGQLAFSADEAQLKQYVGKPVKVSLIVKPGRNGNKAASIKEMVKAEKSEYKSSDFFDGLSSESIEKYILSIKQEFKHIEKNPELWSLVCALYSEETFKMLSEYPATVSGVSKFRGGALAVTANVLELVKNMGVTYVRLSNGLYSENIDWALVLTAAALMELSVSDAYTKEEPFQKTASCIERGYGSLLQSKIDRAIAENALKLSEETYSKLLNILWCVVEQHARISPTSKEGVLLQQAYSTYKRLDYFDLYKTDIASESESGYSYSTQSRMYVSNRDVEKPNENAS